MEEFDINPDRYQNTQRRTRTSWRSETRGYTGINDDEPETVAARPDREEEPARRRRRPTSDSGRQTAERQAEKPAASAETRTARPRKDEARTERPRKSEPRRTDDEESPRIDLLKPFRDRRLHIFLGAALLIVGALMAITLFSYLRTAAADQSHVINQTVEEMAAEGKTANVGGSFGAWFTHAVFSESSDMARPSAEPAKVARGMDDRFSVQPWVLQDVAPRTTRVRAAVRAVIFGNIPRMKLLRRRVCGLFAECRDSALCRHIPGG